MLLLLVICNVCNTLANTAIDIQAGPLLTHMNVVWTLAEETNGASSRYVSVVFN